MYIITFLLPCQVSAPAQRHVRVLSLFDRISTGLYVLKENLGLHVEAYFSSEIDPDAISVQKHVHCGHIVRLGSVKKIGVDLLNTLGRIDLLIGGSPCNELSRVNWRRKGLFGMFLLHIA